MIYKLKDIKTEYEKLIDLSRLIINVSDKTTNVKFEKYLSQYFLNNSIKRANVFYILENDSQIIGALFAYIPDYCSEKDNVDNYKFASNLNCTLLKKLKYENFTQDEFKILKKELLIEKEYCKNVWANTIKKNDSSEILFFSIANAHQKKGYSKALLNIFLEDTKICNIKKYHLFTTSNCDFEYYEKLGMKCTQQNYISKDTSLLVYEKQI